jgi:predicted DNA binding CopG/RHH family protein
MTQLGFLAAQSGANLGGCTMKQPRLKDVKIDVKGTEKMRSRMAKAKKIKITVNIDEDLLESLKLRSDETGVPYQSLLNRVLRSAMLEQKDDRTLRLDRLEKEIALLKRKLSA